MPEKRFQKSSILWAVIAVAACMVLIVCLLTVHSGHSEKIRRVTGLVTELQLDKRGELTAMVIQTAGGESTGILLTEETDTYPPEDGIGTVEEMREAFRAAIRTDVEISADCTRHKETWNTASGAQINTYEAREVRITGWLDRGAVMMRDGTPIDVLHQKYMFPQCVYRLEDGTELLQVRAPYGPDNSYVGGIESLDDVNETARERVLDYYEARGLLYDEQKELEKVYTLYQELGTDFRSGVVEQSVSPVAASDGVMYFLTTVMLPAGNENGNTLYELRLGDAFDRETGEHINTWDLFTAPKEDVIKAMLDENGIWEQPLRSEMEAASWDERIVFFPDSLAVMFEPGTLPSETLGRGLYLDYTSGIQGMIQDWAMPISRS